MRKKILSISYWVVLILLLVILLFLKPKYIETGSMKPTLSVGSLSIINPYNKPEVGDIAMYKVPGGYVIHRVIRIEDDGSYIFKGDNNATEDLRPILVENVVGEELFHLNLVAPIIRVVLRLQDY